jgi:hypothetical protein
MRAYRPVCAVTVSILLAAAGCSSGPATGEVRGKVTYDGKPVTEGSVTFLNPTEGGTAGADIGPDGSYTIDGGVAVGEYLIVVTPPIEIVDTDPGKSPPAPVEKSVKNIPNKYRQQGTTPLRYRVQPGPNEYNVEMEP